MSPTVAAELNALGPLTLARYNSMSITARLPPELLCAIFTSIQQEDPRWCRVSRVCAQWRSLALATPHLWARLFIRDDLPGHSLDWADEMLLRSNEALLSIEFSHPDKDEFPRNSKKIWNHISSEMHRIRSLSFDIPNTNDLYFLTVRRPAPRLETLNITAGPYSRLRDALNLFAGSTEELRTLSLSACTLKRLDAPILLGLTKLYLDYSDARRPDYRYSPHDLLSALQSMPAIQHLHLLNTIAHAREIPGPTPAVLPAAHLPNLRTLTFIDELSICTTFLPRLTWPSTVASVVVHTYPDWHIIPTSHAALYAQLASLSAYVTHLTTTAGDRHVRTLRLRSLVRHSRNAGLKLRVAVSAWDSVGVARNRNSSLRLPPAKPLLTLDMTVPADTEYPYYCEQSVPAARLLRVLWKPLALDGLECLHVDDAPIGEHRQWRAAFGALPILSRICLKVERDRGQGKEFVKALQPDVHRDRDQGASVKLWFTALRNLEVHGWRRPKGENLEMCLRSRRKRGVGLRRLRMEDCGSDEEGQALERLRAVVRTVEKVKLGL